MNTAMFDLIEQHKIDPARVKKVRVALSQPAFDLHGKLAQYKAKFDALISGHYTAAVILHDQELTLAQFEPARYDDPKMRRAAAEQIEIRPDAALTGVQAVVDIEIDGTTLTARCEHPRGSAENPLSRAQIESKFRTYADGVLTPSAIAGTIEAVGDLENLGSVRQLMDMLRRGAAARSGRARDAGRGPRLTRSRHASAHYGCRQSAGTLTQPSAALHRAEKTLGGAPMNRRTLFAALTSVAAFSLAAAAARRRQTIIRTVPSASSCRKRPVPGSTCRRACSRRRWASSGASREWWRIVRAPTPSSEWRPSPRRRPTATRWSMLR